MENRLSSQKESMDLEVEVAAHLVRFWFFRRLVVAVLLGLLPIGVDKQITPLYSWLAFGFAGGALLCWYLPGLGRYFLLDEEAGLEPRKRLWRLWWFIGSVWLAIGFAVWWGIRLHLVRLLYQGETVGSLFVGFLACSCGLSAASLGRRIFSYQEKRIEIVDYRDILSYSLWSFFSIVMMILLLFDGKLKEMP